jgi:hypothetical protein
MRELATCAPGVRLSATGSPDLSTTAITTRWHLIAGVPLPGVEYRSGAGHVDRAAYLYGGHGGAPFAAVDSPSFDGYMGS